MEKAGIGSPEVDLTVGDSWRAYDPAESVIELPFLLAGFGIEGIELGVAATGVNYAIDNCGRGLEANLVMKERIFTAMKAPLFLTVLCVNRIEVTIPATDKEHSVCVGRGG